MMHKLFSVWMVLFWCPQAIAQLESFEYREWTSTDGKAIEARLNKVVGKKVTLQLKKGGKRYTFDTSKLSKESNKYIEGKREEVKKTLKKPKSVDSSTIYQAVALGIGDKVAEALTGKTFYFTLSKIRIETDRVSAYLVLDDALFLKYHAPSESELFEKNDVLYHRPKTKERIDPARTVNKQARKVAVEGAQFEVRFTKKTVLEWGQVGVSEGVIVHR